MNCLVKGSIVYSPQSVGFMSTLKILNKFIVVLLNNLLPFLSEVIEVIEILGIWY